MPGTVEGLFIAEQPAQPMRSVPDVVGEARLGLVGDRHFGKADPSKPGSDLVNLSLVEAEVLEVLRDEYGIELAPHETRRNVVVRGVRLHDLIGQRFRLGALLCEGVEVCQPCSHMQKKVGKPILKPLVHRGGLRARILEGGTVRVGDVVEAVPTTVSP